ncbi:peptidylprolyl isomerase [Vandammella animalimorsus]|uniref:Peptidyl-prolyl cis-trans isomerase n=2 Tax=Vandammella animalimorsus TaxID=2029117 RepID=A0A2A2AAT7_9BURK|nr:peptidylprolyl isomerase [Vandammella animalimorsus]PAT34887.1 peptidylprolyl isomerase [Vandammella animalimorsus]PAX17392.1 peptidylprolyl isomerase [Vandammella animalimorsus]PAX19447.1 peptidylprolyl isomerase [Vandammella animalimorsus]
MHTRPAKRLTLRRLLAAASLSACAAMLLTSPAAAQGKDKQPAASQPRVKLSTSMGDIVVALEPQKAPKTVENFLQYVQDKHYDGTIFHRVIDGFMIQGGGFSADMVQKPTRAPIVLEADNGLKNERGTIAMARTMVPNSATSQFFINVNNNVPLNATPGNPGYAVFGKVVEGMDVVDKIKAVSTTSKGPHQNVPAETITILSATKVD